MSTSFITPAIADILAHTQKNGRYVTNEALVIELGRIGLLKDHGPQQLAGGMHYLTLTTTGREALEDYRETLPKPKPLTRSQLRYREYLEIADLFPNFLSFLKYKQSQPKPYWS